MSPWSRVLPNVHCDSDSGSSLTAAALKSVRTAVTVPESELRRWRRTFDTNAKVVDGEK
jgi:solute carrier family 25 aspartate/glutamate transporter 12/13